VNSVFIWFIERLYEQGISGGCPPATPLKFCPNEPISRMLVALWLTKALGFQCTDVDSCIRTQPFFEQTFDN
jgi:hypothetical protein